MIEYADYIASKASRPVATGLESPCEPSAPLFDFQRDIVKWALRRGLNLWSNPGDLVLSPFAGIGSEGFVSLKMGRKFVGAELKESYWKQAAANLRSAENAEHGSLFNGL